MHKTNETILNELKHLFADLILGRRQTAVFPDEEFRIFCSPFDWWLQSKLHLHFGEVQCACMRCMKILTALSPHPKRFCNIMLYTSMCFPVQKKRRHGKHGTLRKEQHHQESSKPPSGKLERQPDKGNKRRELRITTIKKNIRPSLKLGEKKPVSNHSQIWRRKMHPEVMPKPIGIDIWVFNVNALELHLLTVWGLPGGVTDEGPCYSWLLWWIFFGDQRGWDKFAGITWWSCSEEHEWVVTVIGCDR